MNKNELIDAIAAEAKITKIDAKKALDAYVNVTAEALKNGDKISLIGYGTFSVTERSARQGRDPRSGKTIDIPAKKVVKFKAGAGLQNL